MMHCQRKAPKNALAGLVEEFRQVKAQAVALGCGAKKSRSGRPTRPGFEGGQMPLYRRLPKLKHFPLVNRKSFTIINVENLASLVANSEVTLSSLIEAGIVTSDDGPLKILGNGEINVPLNVKAAAFSATARAKIEAAKGTVELLAD